MRFSTLPQLKDHSKPAHDSLIELWSELSRVTVQTARRYIREDLGARFIISLEDETLTFEDTEARDTFTYDKTTNTWN